MRKVYKYVLQILWLLSLKSQINSYNDYPVPRVINGIPASPGEIPYQVALKMPSKVRNHPRHPTYSAFCGGAILGEKKILSAAHCFFIDSNLRDMCGKSQKLGLKNMYAVAGTVRTLGRYKPDGDSTEQWRIIAETFIPPSYDFPTDDIAVAMTEDPFVFNEYVSPLPHASSNTDYGTIDCIVSGYGFISFNIQSDSLLWAKIALIPKAVCSYLHEQDMNNFICTKSDVSDVFVGDSGGPLVCRNTGDPKEGASGVIVGVVSGKEVFADDIGGGTFCTRVSSFHEFIENNSGFANSAIYFYIFLANYISVLVLFLFYWPLIPEARGFYQNVP